MDIIRVSIRVPQTITPVEFVEFIVLGSDWPDYYPDLVLGMPWFQENDATLDICNSKLLLER